MDHRYPIFSKDCLGNENQKTTRVVNNLYFSSVCLSFPRTIEQEKNIVRVGLYRQNGNMADIQTLRLDFPCKIIRLYYINVHVDMLSRKTSWKNWIQQKVSLSWPDWWSYFLGF